MCMSDKSKWIAVVAVGIMMLTACGEKREMTFESFVTQALRSLYIDNDYNSFVNCVDYGTELDSVQQKVVEAMYRQFTDNVLYVFAKCLKRTERLTAKSAGALKAFEITSFAIAY